MRSLAEIFLTRRQEIIFERSQARSESQLRDRTILVQASAQVVGISYALTFSRTLSALFSDYGHNKETFS